MGWFIGLVIFGGLFALIGWAIVKQQEAEDMKSAWERLKDLAKLEKAGLLTKEEKAESMELLKKAQEYTKKNANPVDRRLMEHEEKEEQKKQMHALKSMLEADSARRNELKKEFDTMLEIMKTRFFLTEEEKSRFLKVIAEYTELNIKFTPKDEVKKLEETAKKMVETVTKHTILESEKAYKEKLEKEFDEMNKISSNRLFTEEEKSRFLKVLEEYRDLNIKHCSSEEEAKEIKENSKKMIDRLIKHTKELGLVGNEREVNNK